MRRYIVLGSLLVVGATTMAVAFQGQPASAPLPEFQRFTADLVAAVDKAVKAGQGADAALASIDIARYKDYKSDFLKGAVDAIHAELKPR